MGKVNTEKKNSKKSKTVVQEVDYKELYIKTLSQLADIEIKCEVLEASNEALIKTLEKTQKVIFAKNEIIEDLEAKLDVAYKEQEQMLEELNEWLTILPMTFEKLEEHTGKITLTDVIYNIELISRVIKNKFEYKSEEFE